MGDQQHIMNSMSFLHAVTYQLLPNDRLKSSWDTALRPLPYFAMMAFADNLSNQKVLRQNPNLKATKNTRVISKGLEQSSEPRKRANPQKKSNEQMLRNPHQEFLANRYRPRSTPYILA